MNSVRMGGIKIRSYKANIYSVPQYFGSPTDPKLTGIYTDHRYFTHIF